MKKQKHKTLTNKTLTTALLFLWTLISFGQKQYIIQTVAFYNLENLFDTINDLDKLDELSPMMEIKSNRTFIYKDKLSKLANILNEVGKNKNNSPPSLIGVAEVENKTVLNDLIKTTPLNHYNYGIIHYDSPDKRGIDTGLIYNKDVYKPIHNQAFSANLYHNDFKIDTRDILWSTGYLLNDKIHILINHWPSRRGGIKKSKPLREKLAKRVLQIVERIYSEESNAKIIIMGDFNDNPTDSSFKKILQTKNTLKNLNSNDLYNPFEKLFKKGHHTLGYKNKSYLFDQIIFSANFTIKNSKSFKFYKAGIHNPSYMIEKSGKHKGKPKRSFGYGRYLKGYSDHFPVYSYLIQENN